MAAVAALSFGSGTVSSGIAAFMVMSITMGLLVFTMAFLGATTTPAVVRPLALWGRRVQLIAASLVIVAGAALIYTSVINPKFFDRLILPM